MNEKEVAEIRRRFKPEKSAVTHVRGCYVSAQGEVVSHFDQSLALMPQEEGENLMNLLPQDAVRGPGPQPAEPVLLHRPGGGQPRAQAC